MVVELHWGVMGEQAVEQRYVWEEATLVSYRILLFAMIADYP